MSKKLNIGLFGFGCVGQGLYHVLNNSKGFTSNITKIAVKDKSKKRSLPQELFTFDKLEILDNPEITVGVVDLEDPQLTGRYYSRIKPSLPLLVGDHRLTEYKATNEHVGWVVNPAIYLEDQLTIEETTYLEHPGIAYRRRSDAPVKIATAKWLRIGRVVESTS